MAAVERVVELQNRIKMTKFCPFKVEAKVATWPIFDRK